MDNLFSALDQKVKTKEDLNLYLEGVSLLKEAAHNRNLDDFEDLDPRLKEKIDNLLPYLKNKEERLAEEKKNKEEKKNSLIEEEKKWREKKRQLNEIIQNEEDAENKNEFQKEKREAEKRRREKEEEIWELEDQILQLENEFRQLKNGDRGNEYKETEEQLSLLQKIEDYLFSLPELRLELAQEPTEETINLIREWFKNNFGVAIVLSIKINSELVAGSIVEYEGKWADFSLAKKMKQIEYDKLFEEEL